MNFLNEDNYVIIIQKEDEFPSIVPSSVTPVSPNATTSVADTSGLAPLVPNNRWFNGNKTSIFSDKPFISSPVASTNNKSTTEVSQESGTRSVSAIVAEYASRKAVKQATPEASKLVADSDTAVTVSIETESKNVHFI